MKIQNVVLIFISLLLLSICVEASNERPRYTLIDERASFLFENHETLPFQIIRQMCWNGVEGFCDSGIRDAEEIFTVIEWGIDGRHGAVFETENGECFWWMYQPEWGSDNNPHIMEHYWISCPLVFEN